MAAAGTVGAVGGLGQLKAGEGWGGSGGGVSLPTAHLASGRPSLPGRICQLQSPSSICNWDGAMAGGVRLARALRRSAVRGWLLRELLGGSWGQGLQCALCTWP